MERKAINYDFLCDPSVCVCLLTILHPLATTTAPVHFRPRSTIIIVWLRSIRYILYARTVSFQVRRMSPAVFAFLLFIVFRPTDTIHAPLPTPHRQDHPAAVHRRRTTQQNFVHAYYIYRYIILYIFIYINRIPIYGHSLNCTRQGRKHTHHYPFTTLIYVNTGTHRKYYYILNGRRDRTGMGWNG